MRFFDEVIAAISTLFEPENPLTESFEHSVHPANHTIRSGRVIGFPNVCFDHLVPRLKADVGISVPPNRSGTRRRCARETSPLLLS
jgi:hypothetical protein